MNELQYKIGSPTRWRPGIAALALGCGSIALITGCGLFGEKQAETTTKPVLTNVEWQADYAAAAPLQPANRPVLQGPLPLVYLVEAPATVRVSNVATGEEIAVFDARAGEIIRIEPRGVLLANRPVIGAQLAPGTYAISFVEPDAGIVHASQQRIIPTLPTASQPATPPAAPDASPDAPSPDAPSGDMPSPPPGGPPSPPPHSQ